MTAKQVRENNTRAILAGMHGAGVLGLALAASGSNDEGDLKGVALVTANGVAPGEGSWRWDDKTRRSVRVPSFGIHSNRIRLEVCGPSQWETVFPEDDGDVAPIREEEMPLGETAQLLAGYLFQRDETGYGTGEDEVEDTFVVMFDTPWDELSCTRTTSVADTLEEAARVVTGELRCAPRGMRRMGW